MQRLIQDSSGLIYPQDGGWGRREFDSFDIVGFWDAAYFALLLLGRVAMYCWSSGDMAMNLMAIPNTFLSSRSKLSDHTILPITRMDLAPGGSRIIEMRWSSSDSAEERIKTPATLISLVFPAIEPWRVSMTVGQLTWVLGCILVSISMIVRLFEWFNSYVPVSYAVVM